MAIQGTATAGTTTQVTLAEAKRFPDDRLIGKSFYVTAGTGAGEEAVVSDNDQGNGTVDFSPALTDLHTDSEIEIWDDGVTPAMVNDLIDLAILEAQDEILYPQRVAPASVDTTNYRWIKMPTSNPFVAIYAISYEEDAEDLVEYRLVDTYADMRREPDYTAFIRGLSAGGVEIHLRPTFPSDRVASQFLIMGYRKAALPTADTDSLEMPADYVTMSAAHMLAIATASQSRPELAAQGDLWMRRSRHLKNQWRTRFRPGTRPVEVYSDA